MADKADIRESIKQAGRDPSLVSLEQFADGLGTATKAEIVAAAEAELGLELDAKQSKQKLIAALYEQLGESTAESTDAEPAPETVPDREVLDELDGVLAIMVSSRGERGFRRAGIRFTPEPQELELDALEPEQIRAILTEPNLIVEAVR